MVVIIVGLRILSPQIAKGWHSGATLVFHTTEYVLLPVTLSSVISNPGIHVYEKLPLADAPCLTLIYAKSYSAIPECPLYPDSVSKINLPCNVSLITKY